MQEYIFGAQVHALFHGDCCSDVLAALWHGFCSRAGSISFTPTEDLVFILGHETPPALEGSDEYALRITAQGAAIAARSREALCRGYLSLLRRIRPVCLEEEQESFSLAPAALRQSFDVPVRMVHLCVFPETTLIFLRKMIRLCAVLQYTHVILEFWGMLRFDCMKELAWPCAFAKEDIRPIIDEIRALGMQPVPMFNHLGHAAGSRLKYGKHVVLDQNPRLRTYFGEDGWTWNIKNPRTLSLLKNVRQELSALFGPGDYFHIGVDEAYKYGWDYSLAEDFAAYLGDLTENILDSEHRRPIIWGDMLLNKQACGVENAVNKYFCLCKDQRIADAVFERLDRRVVIADWQYDALQAPFQTSMYLRDKGFDVLCCPWDNIHNVQAAVETVRSEKLFGYMDTTWHTLFKGMNALYTGAYLLDPAHAGENAPERHQQMYDAAALFRFVSDEFSGYEHCGWKQYQIEW